MKNKLLTTSLSFYGLATLLGIIATTGISEARDSLRAFHFGSTAVMLGLLGVGIMIIARWWKE